MFDKGLLEYLVVGNKCYKSDNTGCLGLIEMVFAESAYFRVRWLGINYGYNDYPFEMVFDFNFQKGSKMLGMDMVVKYHKKMNFFNRDIYLNKEIQMGLKTESRVLEREKEILELYDNEVLDQKLWLKHIEDFGYVKYDQWFEKNLEFVIAGEDAPQLERVLHMMGLMDWFGKPERVRKDWNPHKDYLVDRLSFNRVVLKRNNLDIIKGFRCCKDIQLKKTKLKLYNKSLECVMTQNDFLKDDVSLVLEKRATSKKEIIALDSFYPDKLKDEFIAF